MQILRIGVAALVVVAVAGVGVTCAEESPEAPMAREAPAGRWISTSAVDASTGDYGSGEDTTVTQFSQTFTYRGHRGEVGLMVPYLHRNGAGVTAGEATRARRGRTLPDETSGLGDIRLKAKSYWLEETDLRPSVDLSGQIKFPTADEDEGLGTGRFDVGFGPEFLKRLGALIAFGDLQLVLRDTPSDSAIKPVRLDYAAGLGYPLTEKFTAYASLEGSTQSSSGVEAPLELVFSGVWKATERVGLRGYLLAGLTEGSPDFGGGASVVFQF